MKTNARTKSGSTAGTFAPKRIINLIFLGFICFFLLPYTLLSFFAYPCADDYAFFVTIPDSTFFEAMIHNYMSWSGMYSTTALDYILFNTIPIDSYWIYPLVIFLLLYLSLLLLFRDHVSTDDTLTPNGFSLLGLALITALLPDTAAMFYWISGLCYPFAIIFFILFTKYALRILSNTNLPGDKILCSIFLVLCSGCRYETAMLLPVIVIAMVVYKIYHKQPVGSFLYVLFMLSSVSFLIVFLAPGNFARMATTDLHKVNSLIAFCKGILPETTLAIVRNPTFAFSVLLFMPLFKPVKSFARLTLILMFTGVAVFFIEMAFCHYAFGTIPARTSGEIYVLFSILFVVFLGQAFKLPVNGAGRDIMMALAQYVILCGLYIQTRPAYDDFMYKAFKFKEECAARDMHINNMRDAGCGDVMIKAFKNIPKTIFEEDLRDDREWYHNKNMAKLFNVNSIRTEP